MKTIIKRTILFVSFMVAMTDLFAQNNIGYSIELLKKEWIPVGLEGKAYSSTTRYYNEKVISVFKFNGEEDVLEHQYYLSDNQDTTFDRNKVGKIKSGRYIIQKTKYEVLAFEIVELTTDTLKFKNSSNVIVEYSAKK